jgi:PIN domain nuclease of toxin-antitoxin system
MGVVQLRVLLDSHTLLWWILDHPALTPAAREAISGTDNTVLVSAASAWELAIKFRAGRLPEAADLVSNFPIEIVQEGFQLLPISAEHGIRAGLLPGPHKDPFDRMLIAQSQAEDIPIVSNEAVFDTYGVRRLW